MPLLNNSPINRVAHPNILSGPRQPELIRDEVLADILEATAVRMPHKIALIFADRHLTYQELNAQADQVASSLIEAGVRPGQAVLLQNTPPAQRPAAFAQAWTRFEACLKCRGLALTEWTPSLAQQLATCHVMELDLPENCRGAIAVNQAIAMA